MKLECPVNAKGGQIIDLQIKLFGSGQTALEGCHGVDIQVLRPNGQLDDSTAIYRLEDGSTKVKIRLPLDAPCGIWKIKGQHLASSLQATTTFNVINNK